MNGNGHAVGRRGRLGTLADLGIFEREDGFLEAIVEIEEVHPFGTEEELLAAPQRIASLRAMRGKGSDFFSYTIKIFTVLDQIALTVPKTRGGALVKLRALLDGEGGLGAGITQVEIQSLGHVLRFFSQ